MKETIPRLPTHLALVARRMEAVGREASADTFLTTSYLVEATVKTLALVLASAIRERAPEDAYRFEYGFVRADGLGTWADAIEKLTSSVYAQFLPPQVIPLRGWLSKKRTKPDDEWFRTAVQKCQSILRAMGQEVAQTSLPLNVATLLTLMVRIRNKTKAHGAFGPDFFAEANAPYREAAQAVVEECPLLNWRFLYASPTAAATRVFVLVGLVPEQSAESLGLPNTTESVYLATDTGAPIHLPLISSNKELSVFFLPNGHWVDKATTAEFIDYASGKTVARDCSLLSRPPAPLPRSETHGDALLDVCSNVWGNLPAKRSWYARRKQLEAALMERLLDRNHAIITLHGIGGIGKTSLALCAAHELSAERSPRFDRVLWFSARDLDLRQSGPSVVAPAVLTLDDIAHAYGSMMQSGTTLQDFARALQEPEDNGCLFIFDNFETLAEPKALHQFLDTHTHLPNKVLITSRERAFKADYPIEVKGMEWPEAEVVILQTARRFSIEGQVSGKSGKRIWEHAEGHPYLMQILVGEIAAAGQYVPPPTVLSKRSDILEAIFERSFAKLSDDGRWCFLLVSNWRAPIPDISLYAVGIERAKNFETGIEECLRFSLVSEVESLDGQLCYEAAQVARLFGKKKLLGDADRLAVQAALELIRGFGVIEKGAEATRLEDVLRAYFEKAISQALGMTSEERATTDRVLTSVAERWPQGWALLARFRSTARMEYKAIDEAARRAVEEMPNDVAAWRERAEYARFHNEQQTEMACWVSVVEAQPTDVMLVSEAAQRLNNYVGQIPIERRTYYIASVRDRMEKLAKKLDATGRSRLAWLYLHEEDYQKAKEHVEAGLKLDGTNTHCVKLWERLKDY